MKLWSSPRRLRVHLAILVLASTLPLLIFAVVVAMFLERHQRAAVERGLRDTARALSVAVNLELTTSISALETLATSEHLDGGNLRSFYDQAQRALKAHPRWKTISLLDASGQQRLNLLRPFGAPLPASADLEVVRRALDTGRPAVSDLLVGPVFKAPIIGIAVPVIRGGGLKYLVGAGLDVAYLSHLLGEGGLPPDWIATIIDRNGMIVARTRDADRWLAQAGSPVFAAQSRQFEEGSFRDVTREGIAVYSAYSRSRLSGWTVSVGVPAAAVAAPRRFSAWILIGGGLVSFLIAGLSAAVIGKRINRGIGSLSALARALGSETPAAAIEGSGIAEIESAKRELAGTARSRAEAVAARAVTEEALRENEASFRLLFENNPLPMWVSDEATGFFLEVNAAAVEHYGYSRDEFLRMRVVDIQPSGDLPAADTEGTGRRRLRTYSHRLKSGQIRQVDVASHAIEFGGRRATLAVAIDVTDLRQAEASLAQYAERFKILHEIDAAIIGAQAPDAIAEAVLRPLRDLLGVPRAIVNLFDFAAGEAEWLAAIGRRRTRLGPGVRFPLALMGDLEALRRGEVQILDTAAQAPGPALDALLASGVRVYMVVPMIAGGELIGAISFGGANEEFSAGQIDIAREVAAQLAIAIAQARLYERVKRQAEELEERVGDRTLALSAANEQLEREINERRQAEAEADRANRAKSDFLSRMSHELRTPLNAILGFGQLLETRVAHARDQESVEQILRGGRHLLNLINEVLDISRIESGALALSLEPVRLDEAISHVVDLARPLANQRSVQIQADAATHDVRYVRADTQRLRQVLLNLVSNGIKYNREGGRLALACQEGDAGRLRITVTDTGAGIPRALQSRLFTPFDRLGAEAEAVEGTGLGLALSKRLVEVMGGTIGFESVEGEGTTFWVELPRADAPRPRAETRPSGQEPEAGATERQGTILYIEDNPSNLRLVERILAERSALRLIPAMQGRLGLELARKHHPDLILLDLHLPDMSGEEVLREVRDDVELRQTPVIVLSADATPGQIKRLLAAGAQAYLTKPLDIQQLLSLVDAALPTR